MRSLLAFQFMAGMLDIMYCDNTLMKKYLTKATPRLAEPAKYCNTVDLRCVSLCPKLAALGNLIHRTHIPALYVQRSWCVHVQRCSLCSLSHLVQVSGVSSYVTLEIDTR